MLKHLMSEIKLRNQANRLVVSRSSKTFVAKNLHSDLKYDELSLSDSDIQEQKIKFAVQPEFQSSSSQYQVENIDDCNEEYNKRIKAFKDRIKREQVYIHQLNEDDQRHLISFAIEDEEKLKWLEKRIQKVDLKQLISEVKMLHRKMTLKKKSSLILFNL